MRISALVMLVLVATPGWLAAADSTGPPRAGQLSFGCATTSITPDTLVALGGQYNTRISGEVHDPLSAAALALETRDESGVIDQAVFVACDLSAIRRLTQDAVRKRVKERLADLDPMKIFISATHTHTAPALTDAHETDLHPYDFMGSWAYRIPKDQSGVMQPAEYLDFLADRLAGVVVEAWQARKPGGVSSGLGHAVVAHNRRAVYTDGSARMYGDTREPGFSHIEGVSDHSIDVLFFWRGAGQLDAMVINVYCPAQEVEGERYMSADYWYDARKLLHEKYGAKLCVLPLTGAAGDQSPHLMWNKDAERIKREAAGLSSREEIARRIVAAVDTAAADARRKIRTRLEFQHRVEVVPLPVWQVSADQYTTSRALFDAGQDKTDELSSPDYINWRVSRTLLARHAHQKTEPYYQSELHVLRLGDVAVTTNPFELYTDYGVRIKARSPAPQTLVVQLTSDGAGYLPTKRAVAGGGYSARIVDGVVGPEGGDVLVDETVKSLGQMWPRK